MNNIIQFPAASGDLPAITFIRQKYLRDVNRGLLFWHIFTDIEATRVKRELSEYVINMEIPTTARAVYYRMVDRTLGHNKIAELFYLPELAVELNVSERTIKYAIAKLKEAGLIRRIQLNKNKKQGAYVLILDHIGGLVIGKNPQDTVGNYIGWEMERMSLFSRMMGKKVIFGATDCTNEGVIGATDCPIHNKKHTIPNGIVNLNKKHIPPTGLAESRSLVFNPDRETQINMEAILSDEELTFSRFAPPTTSDAPSAAAPKVLPRPKSKNYKKAATESKKALPPSSLRDIVDNATTKYEAKLKRDTEKAERSDSHRPLTVKDIEAVWTSAMREYHPEVIITPLVGKDGYRLRSFLKARLTDKSDALNFIRFAVANWNRFYLSCRDWMSGVSDLPNYENLISMGQTILRGYRDDNYLTQGVRRTLLSPLEQLEENMRRRGYNDDEIAYYLAKRKAKEAKRDDAEQILQKAKNLYASANALRNETKKDIQNAHLEIGRRIKSAIQKGADKNELNDLVLADRDKMALGPDGKEYPMDVYLYMDAAPWCDDEAEMNRLADEEFFKAVDRYNQAVNDGTHKPFAVGEF